MSLKSRIYEFIRLRHMDGAEWVRKVEIEDYSRSIGYDAENGTRRARELCQVGTLQRDGESQYTKYRVKSMFSQ